MQFAIVALLRYCLHRSWLTGLSLRFIRHRRLKLLSGGWHEVITGICIYNNDRCLLEHEVTQVHFVDMNEKEINDYINSDEPYDKAGAYGVQGIAGMYIDEIKGDFYNIMGFPMAKVYNMLKMISAIDTKG